MRAQKRHADLGKMLITALAVVVAGCVDLPSVSKVEGFRVLGVRAEPPEIAPGEGAVFEVLWADPGADREVAFAWIGCAGYVHSSEGLRTCEMIVPPVIMSAEEGGDRLEVPATPPNLMDFDIFGEGFVKVTMVVLMCANGSFPAPDAFASERDVLNVNTLCDGEAALSAYKTITISTSDNPQRNPAIETLEADGEALRPASEGASFTVQCVEREGCGAEVALSAFFTEESAQTYERVEFGKPVTYDERLYVSWFVTGGELESSRVGAEDEGAPLGPYENVWLPDNPGTYTLYVVGHDVRGGAGWQTYTFEVLP